jgi:hypothetical protein
LQFGVGFFHSVHISRAPNATTTVTLTQTTGSANGADYTISPSSIDFTTTDTTDKYFSIAINPDAVMEGHEMAYFNLAASGSNATVAVDSFELIIMNDDWPLLMAREHLRRYCLKILKGPLTAGRQMTMSWVIIRGLPAEIMEI